MTRFPLALPLAVLAVSALASCGGSAPSTGTTADTPAVRVPSADLGTMRPGPTLLGAMRVNIDRKTLAVTTEPVLDRFGQDRGDVVDGIDLTYYFSNPVFCKDGDCISVTSVGLDDLGGTLTVPLVSVTFKVKHPFDVASPPVTGVGRSRNDLGVENVRGYIVNGGPDPLANVKDTGIPLVPAGIVTNADTDTGNIQAYLGPLTGAPFPGAQGYVYNAEGMNNGADGILTTIAGNPVAEASLPLFDYESPAGFNGVFASPYIEFIPVGDTGHHQLAQGQTAEATYLLNAAPGDDTVSFIFALAGNYGNSAGPIATDAPSEKVIKTRERRGAPIYYYPGFNKSEALGMVEDTVNTTAGAAGTNAPVDLYVDVTDMQADAQMPASWDLWYNPATEADVDNKLPPDTTVVTGRGGFSTVFVLGTPTPSGGGLTGILNGESPSLIAWDAPTKGGVQRLGYCVFDNATGTRVLDYNAANDILGANIIPAGVGLPIAGQAHGTGRDAQGVTLADPLKAHIQLPTGTGVGQLPSGTYTVVVVAWDDLIDNGDTVNPDEIFEESAWNMGLFQVTVNP
ncbi:MAG: hypothetical protein ABI743_08255 [bacterium]